MGIAAQVAVTGAIRGHLGRLRVSQGQGALGHLACLCSPHFKKQHTTQQTLCSGMWALCFQAGSRVVPDGPAEWGLASPALCRYWWSSGL